MTRGLQYGAGDGSREQRSNHRSHVFPGATLKPSGNGKVRWRALSRVIMMVRLIGTQSLFQRDGEGKPLGVGLDTKSGDWICHGISVDDCAKTENLYRPYEAVLRPGTVPGLKTASYGLYRVLCRSQSAIKMPSKVAAGALIFT